jgi:hypothetical protein
MNLMTEMERWRKYWRTVIDADDVERQLRRLRWLNDFAFHCGQAISPEYFQALQQQIETRERKLAELRGEQSVEVAVPKTRIDSLQVFETAPAIRGEMFVPKTDFETGAR